MTANRSGRWWGQWHIWLIIAGPLLVVMASFYTYYLATQNPDPAIEDYYRKGIEINKTLRAQESSLAPAIQARNHAATGVPGKVPSK